MISVAELKEHIAFLRDVHKSSHGDESLYADSKRLRAAVRAYLAWLAARAAAASFGGTALVTCPPPLDIAWVWHVHRLEPLAYARLCATLGAFVAPAPGVGFAASGSADTLVAIADGKDMEDALVAAAIRHAGFLWQVSGAAYNNDAFLEQAIARYERFAALSTTAAGSLAPAVDVDLVWHTHMLRGADYASESAAMCGGTPLDHDNSEGMSGGPLLDAAWSRTLSVWNGPREGDDPARAVLPSGAQRRGELLRIVDAARYPAWRQDHRRRDDRPRQRPPPRLVDPGDGGQAASFVDQAGHASRHGGKRRISPA